MVQAPSLFEKIRNGSTESREQKEEIVLATFEDHINVLRQPRIEDEPSLSLSLWTGVIHWFRPTMLNLPTRDTRVVLHPRRVIAWQSV